MVDVQLPTALVTCEVEGTLPFHERRTLLEGAIVAPGPDGTLVRFKVATGLDMVIDLADESGPVGYASAQCVRLSLLLG